MEKTSHQGVVFASIVTLNVTSGRIETYARGIRNSVGFDWHPDSGALYFTDNGRDKLGNDLPDCTLKRAERGGLDFGVSFVVCFCLC